MRAAAKRMTRVLSWIQWISWHVGPLRGRPARRMLNSLCAAQACLQHFSELRELLKKCAQALGVVEQGVDGLRRGQHLL